MNALKKAVDWATKLECAVAAAGLGLVAAILLADVIGREFVGSGIYWGPRLASYLTTIAGMLGFSIVVAGGDHLRPDAIDKVFPDAWDGRVNRLADLISASICAFLAYHAWLFVDSTYVIGTRAIAIDMPVWPIQMIVPYVFFSATVRYLFFALYPEARPEKRKLGQ